MNTKMSKLALALGALVAAGGAMAADSGTTTMGVSAAIVNECSLGNVTALAFGNLAMLTSGAQSSTASASSGGGTFDAICTNGAPTPKLRFTSANVGGTSSFRLVGADATTFIAYTVAESGGTAITYGTDAAFTGFAADGTVDSLTLTGSISAAQKAAKPIQAYTDTITITSSFDL